MAQKTKAIYMMIWLMASGFIYFLVQFLVTDSYSFMTPLDGVIPFIPEFIWVYHTLIPVIIITTIFSMEKRLVFFNTVIALSIAAAALTTFHILFPSFYPRQAIDTGTLSLWLVDFTREIDAACNTFPSGHVTFSWILYFCIVDSICVKRTKWLRLTYLLWASLIALSTLVLKQHYIFDVAAGLALAYVSVGLARKVRGRFFHADENT